MIENNKCILAYGLSNIELDKMKKLNYKLIEITPEMSKMTIKDILDGMRLEVLNGAPIKEKVVLFNNFPQDEIKENIKIIREFLKSGIMAIVTPVSINWEVNYLIEHLIEERDWSLKSRKE